MPTLLGSVPVYAVSLLCASSLIGSMSDPSTSFRCRAAPFLIHVIAVRSHAAAHLISAKLRYAISLRISAVPGVFASGRVMSLLCYSGAMRNV